ncbi:MAG: PqqD family protein [Bacteroidetes bacterium]|nr:PqqD family protein [Rhodothermaceae bacterium RA]RMH53811.1 MAG: PqqD family protein [Bacteroidota bacterium]
MAAQYTPHPDVSFTSLDESESVLLHMKTKQYYSLNETGTFIWDAFQQGATVEDIAERLTEVYDIERDDALEYVAGFFEELSSEGLVQRVDGP